MAEEKERKYKNDVLFMHRSEKQKHFYVFGGKGQDGEEILGGGVKSLLINRSELEEFMRNPKIEWVKVSVMREDSAEAAGKEVKKNGKKKTR